MGAALAAVVVAAATALYLRHTAKFESTDDAFIAAHVSHIAPRVSGVVQRVFVRDNQLVRRGTQMDFAYVMWARCLQAGSVALLIVPITRVAYVGIPGHKSSNASALINLARNIGGSFGISLAQTWLARRTLLHHARLVEYVLPNDHSYLAELHRLATHFIQSGSGPVAASRRALAAINAGIEQQARMLAFNDVFYLMALGSLLVLPCVLLLGRVREKRA